MELSCNVCGLEEHGDYAFCHDQAQRHLANWPEHRIRIDEEGEEKREEWEELVGKKH
jgi:hypothetical protein